MRLVYYAVFFCCLLFSVQPCFGQDDQPLIEIDKSRASFENFSENDYRLSIEWTSEVDPAQYRVRYSTVMEDVCDTTNRQVDFKFTDSLKTAITLDLKSNDCYFQVDALNGSSQVMARSGVYHAAFRIEEPTRARRIETIFIKAFVNSFMEMDLIAGWSIVFLIILLLLYGGYMALSINRAVSLQDHNENGKLKIKVEEYMQRWRDSVKDKKDPATLKELELLRSDIKAYNDGAFCILTIFEQGLDNYITNFDHDTVTEKVDRDMEKAIEYELESMRLGNYSKRAKHISLNRIKMFGETAPMLGLLGTVCGLIVAFYNILRTSREGGAYQELLSELSSGIYSAIITTIIGLIVGIILLYIHHAAESNIKRLQNAWYKQQIEIGKIIS
ncbi:MotA/TolQ/ExbB proton channel family protein [candidate division KSB1 bacterium]|nr:MotA/TolQ/ExbB proton channel family protein [candidate division KSB1 bacterium]